MTEQDVQGGVRLNTLSGWNQTVADWRRFLENSPCGCFVMEHNRKVVGTATSICYENRFAWIGMVLVDTEYRKQGIGTQLLKKAIEYLDDSNIPTIKLDATPQGKPLYAKLGFVEEYEIERWILKRPSGAVLTTLGVTRASLSEIRMEQIFRLDKELFGADRSFLLRSLFDERPEFAMAAWENGLPQGYSLGRCGLFADHLGPWMARSRAAAENILQEFLSRSSRETLIVDSIKSNPMAVGLLSASGFAPSRPLTRMFRGPNTHPGKPDLFCAILGPEFG
jgi:N-acetylglutamate synthase-like GNAT family acetyltransferase